MRTLLLAVLSCFVLTTNLNAQVFSPLHLFEAVPDIVKQLTDAQYKVWAIQHNEAAHRNTTFAASNVVVSPTASTRIDNTFSESDNRPTSNVFSSLFDTPQRRHVNWNRGSNRSVTTTFTQDRWGGGPVLLLNPYCRD